MWIYCNLFIHSTIDEYLNVFFSIIKKVTVNTLITCLLLYMHKATYTLYLGHIPRNEMVVTRYTHLWTYLGMSLLPKYLPWFTLRLGSSLLCNLDSIWYCQTYFIVGFVCFSLITNKVEYLFITLWAICVSSAVKMLLHTFCSSVYWIVFSYQFIRIL